MRRVDPWLVVGGALTSLLLLAALYGDRLAPYEDIVLRAQGPAGEDCPLPPGPLYALGSDNLGRDLASLVLIGARATLVVALLAGAVRVLIGIAAALLGAWVRPLGPALDGAAEALGSFPATLAALLLVVALFAGAAPTAGAVVVTLAIVGWTGPYRVLRAELRRLSLAPFTEGARSLGLRERRVLLRHHLPHLVPLVALAGAQQVTASLVALAELGVLGVFIGGMRVVNLSESVVTVRVGGTCGGLMPDVVEWAGLLAAARGLSGQTAVQNLYLSRWVFLVPAAAIAFAALAVSLLGIGVARQYARRDMLRDLSPRRVLAATFSLALVAAPAVALPPRDAAALDLAGRARAAVTSGDVAPADVERAARDAGLAVARVERSATVTALARAPELVVRSGSVARRLVGGWSRDADFAPVLFAGSGGATVDAAVVFVGLGIARSDYPRPPANPFSAPTFADVVGNVADDYAGVDVAGKAVLFIRAANYAFGRRPVGAPGLDTQIRSAVSRGASAVLVVDPRWEVFGVGASAPPNPYLELEREEPLVSLSGVPVLVVSQPTADIFLAGSGVSMRDVFPGNVFQFVALDDERFRTSLARPLAARVQTDVRVDRRVETSTSIVATTPAEPGDGTLVVWAIAPSRVDATRDAARAIAAVIGIGRVSDVPVAFVLFDPSGETNENARLVAARLEGRAVRAVVGVDSLVGERLRFHTRFGILQPAFDRYADRVGAPHLPSGGDTEPSWRVGMLAAFPETPYVLLRGEGRAADRAGDAAAMLAYAIARFAARAPELVP